MVDHDDKPIIGMGLDKVVRHNSDVIASDVSDADGMGHVPDSYFRQIFKMGYPLSTPLFFKIFFQIFSFKKNAALFKASYTVQWYGIDAVLRPLIPWPRILVLTGFSGGASIG